MGELFGLYRRCFPCCVREEAAVREMLDGAAMIEERTEAGQLIGASAIEDNNILLLCVDRPFRNRGIGSRLLAESERIFRQNGFDLITIGAGAHYIMPGVPSVKPMPGDRLEPDAVDPNLEDHVSFFVRRGYCHRWDCSCFDMRMKLDDFSAEANSDGIVYRFAEPEDIPAVLECVADAHDPFVKHYRKPELYESDNPTRVLIAECDGWIAGALLVSLESEGPGRGSVGCTAVRERHQGRGIASNLVILGTKRLKEAGMREAFLGYTYSGLDKLYGRAGYRICGYYFMAEKNLATGGK